MASPFAGRRRRRRDERNTETIAKHEVFEMPDGISYAPIGSDPDAGAKSTRAMTWANSIHARLRSWEDQIRSNITDMRVAFPAIFVGGALEIRLRGEVDGRDLYVVHEAPRTRIWVGQLSG